MKDNIHPIFDAMLSQVERQIALGQKGLTIWFTGLSGSGKSTLAIALEKRLMQDGKICTLIDGDNIRSGINKDLGFSDDDRKENLRRIAEINKLFNHSGIISISSFISPKKIQRDLIRSIIGTNNFIEIYVATSLEECERRDVKGLYQKARKGEIKNFTGIDSVYEVPNSPDFTITTEKSDPIDSLNQVYSQLLKLTEFENE